ncbi:hypothetical protein Aca07nite_70230 [Actinoplanes capillaceus]|uniref:Uncharacterized protein n=1 Tax=Actinoplanes campanulatus TaxID=113559 RepID=A0ABQ3WU72_9ACTN|nr:hypothetical protein Aca07nite_70230 [Actinoplanes capillaceus]
MDVRNWERKSVGAVGAGRAWFGGSGRYWKGLGAAGLVGSGVAAGLEVVAVGSGDTAVGFEVVVAAVGFGVVGAAVAGVDVAGAVVVWGRRGWGSGGLGGAEWL